jgi:hypothetical protein
MSTRIEMRMCRYGLLTLLLTMLALGACKKDPSTEEPPEEPIEEPIEEPTCEDGERGCPCFEDGTCRDDLQCRDGLCQAPESVGMIIGSEVARACDVLLENVETTRVVRVLFGDEVEGRFLQEGERTALSFIALSDEPFEGDAVQVETLGRAAQDIQVVRVQCADKDGAPIANVQVELR